MFTFFKALLLPSFPVIERDVSQGKMMNFGVSRLFFFWKKSLIGFVLFKIRPQRIY
jgi:hypothetical protein